MGRKTKRITLTDDGNQLTFEIMQMSAFQFYDWFIDVSLAIGEENADLLMNSIQNLFGGDRKGKQASSDEKDGMGLMGTIMKLILKVKPASLKDLLARLYGCCSKVDGDASMPCTMDSIDGMFTDFRNIFRLQLESLRLNMGFMKGGGKD